jgi:hypothetical protein
VCAAHNRHEADLDFGMGRPLVVRERAEAFGRELVPERVAPDTAVATPMFTAPGPLLWRCYGGNVSGSNVRDEPRRAS